jgi:GNAT superfamily N-acetyltransferase
MVRPAEATDAAVLARMLHDFNLEFGDPSPGVAFLVSRVRELITSGSKHYLLAGAPGVEGPAVDGFAQVDFRATVWSRGPVALIEELYVRPPIRGKGLGKELMNAVLELARNGGAAMVEVVTGEDDTAARGLYESSGFTNHVEGEDSTSALYYELEL